jgi:hypothetical protein
LLRKVKPASCRFSCEKENTDKLKGAGFVRLIAIVLLLLEVNSIKPRKQKNEQGLNDNDMVVGNIVDKQS